MSANRHTESTRLCDCPAHNKRIPSMKSARNARRTDDPQYFAIISDIVGTVAVSYICVQVCLNGHSGASSCRLSSLKIPSSQQTRAWRPPKLHPVFDPRASSNRSDRSRLPFRSTVLCYSHLAAPVDARRRPAQRAAGLSALQLRTHPQRRECPEKAHLPKAPSFPRPIHRTPKESRLRPARESTRPAEKLRRRLTRP